MGGGGCFKNHWHNTWLVSNQLIAFVMLIQNAMNAAMFLEKMKNFNLSYSLVFVNPTERFYFEMSALFRCIIFVKKKVLITKYNFLYLHCTVL